MASKSITQNVQHKFLYLIKISKFEFLIGCWHVMNKLKVFNYQECNQPHQHLCIAHESLCIRLEEVSQVRLPKFLLDQEVLREESQIAKYRTHADFTPRHVYVLPNFWGCLFSRRFFSQNSVVMMAGVRLSKR